MLTDPFGVVFWLFFFFFNYYFFHSCNVLGCELSISTVNFTFWWVGEFGLLWLVIWRIIGLPVGRGQGVWGSWELGKVTFWWLVSYIMVWYMGKKLRLSHGVPTHIITNKKKFHGGPPTPTFFTTPPLPPTFLPFFSQYMGFVHHLPLLPHTSSHVFKL